MLTKRQLKQQARKLILKQGLNHQTVYDQLKKERSDITKEDIAEVLSQIPSKEIIERTSFLRLLFSLCLILFFITQTIMFFVEVGNSYNTDLLVYLFVGLVIPIMGLYGAYTHSSNFYSIVAGFVSVGFVDLISDFNLFSFLAALPLLGAAIFGLILYKKSQLSFTEKMVQREMNGRAVNVYEYFFDQSKQEKETHVSELLEP